MKKKLTDSQMDSRNDKIIRLYKSGKYSIRSLAKKVSMSKSRVGEIVQYC